MHLRLSRNQLHCTCDSVGTSFIAPATQQGPAPSGHGSPGRTLLASPAVALRAISHRARPPPCPSQARRWTTPPRKASPSRTSRYNHDDFVRRLEDAHMTVLDSRDGKMDGKYFGHDLKALGHLDGPTTSTTAYRRAY